MFSFDGEDGIGSGSLREFRSPLFRSGETKGWGENALPCFDSMKGRAEQSRDRDMSRTCMRAGLVQRSVAGAQKVLYGP